MRTTVLTGLTLVSLLTGRPEPAGSSEASDARRFRPLDVFELEWASEPQIAPDGQRVVFVRNSMDIMADRRRSALWIVGADGSDLRPLSSGTRNDVAPRWSPDGRRLAFLSRDEAGVQLHVRWMDTGQVARLTSLQSPPQEIAWSPDGRWLAFLMHVRSDAKPFAELPANPRVLSGRSRPASSSAFCIEPTERAIWRTGIATCSCCRPRAARRASSRPGPSTTTVRPPGRPTARRS